MKTDPPAAALRLMQSLPVRTHERDYGLIRRTQNANNTRPVIVNGTLYESLTEASRQCGIGREAIRKRIYKGTARYAS